LIITILFHEFFQGGAATRRYLNLQFKAESRQKPDNFGEAKFSKAAILQCVKRGMPYLRLFRKRRLAESKRLPLDGNLLADGEQG
jgi:hypothetical protein